MKEEQVEVNANPLNLNIMLAIPFFTRMKGSCLFIEAMDLILHQVIYHNQIIKSNDFQTPINFIDNFL